MIDLMGEEFDFNLDIGDSTTQTESVIDYVQDAMARTDYDDTKYKSVNDKVTKAHAYSGIAQDMLKDVGAYQPSIVARARNSVLQFPVYITQGIRVDEAHVISKLFERVYTTLVQTVISQHPILDEREANNLVFLKKFHTNLKESATVAINKYYEAIDDLDQMMQDSLFYTEAISNNCVVEFRLGRPSAELIAENSRLLNEPLSGFFYLREAKDTVSRKSSETITDADGNTTVKTNSTKETRVHTDDVKVPIILKEAEIRKINSMLPYTIEVQFRLKGADGKLQDATIKYILGIKSVLHLISIKDLSEDLRDIISGEMKSLRKVKYKTGEISFKDYLFDVSNAKKAALDNVKTGKKWLNTLRRLGDYQKLNGTLFGKGSVIGTAFRATGTKGATKLHDKSVFPIPNGTMVLSQPEVMKLTNDTGIDLSVVANAKRLAKALFLVAVVIVDSTAGTMRVLFTDSDNAWDVQSLSSIQSEVNKVDNKKLANELNHMINR